MNHSATLTATLALALASAAHAQSLPACRALTDPAQRLACYDALPLPAETAAQRFGQAQQTDPAAPSEVVSQINGLFEGWEPSTVLTLANGQRWRISDGSSATWRKQNPKVTISRGVLGSFNLQIEGLNKTAKVRRVD